MIFLFADLYFDCLQSTAPDNNLWILFEHIELFLIFELGTIVLMIIAWLRAYQKKKKKKKHGSTKVSVSIGVKIERIFSAIRLKVSTIMNSKCSEFEREMAIAHQNEPANVTNTKFPVKWYGVKEKQPKKRNRFLTAHNLRAKVCWSVSLTQAQPTIDPNN